MEEEFIEDEAPFADGEKDEATDVENDDATVSEQGFVEGYESEKTVDRSAVPGAEKSGEKSVTAVDPEEEVTD